MPAPVSPCGEGGQAGGPGARSSVNAMPLKPGDKAPAFTLLDHSGAKLMLYDYKGRKVFLFFYPSR
jgi:peroxiredoxin